MYQGRKWAALGGSNNGNFMGRESGVAECIFAVTLLEYSAAFDGQGREQETKRDLAAHRGIGI